MQQFSDDVQSYIDALRLSAQDQQSLVTEMDRGARTTPGIDKRKSKRLPYASVQGLILQVTHPGGTTVRFMVKPRNLSRTGLSVLHGGFIHPGTPCVTPLRDLRGEPKPVRGTVVACRHVRGRVHELGIEFDGPIPIHEYVLDAQTLLTEGDPITLPVLSGRALVVEEWEADRELLAYDLQKLGVQVTQASSGDAAIRALHQQRFHIVLAGEWLGDMSAAYLAGVVHAAGYDVPIIGVFSGGSRELANRAIRSGLATVVNKPCALEYLSQILLQHLSLDDAACDEEDAQARDPGGLSARWHEVGMRPMILAFLQGFDERLSDLEHQLADPANPGAVQACIRLKGSAASYGFPRLTKAADELASLVEQQAPLEDLKTSMNHLTQIVSAALHATETHAPRR